MHDELYRMDRLGRGAGERGLALLEERGDPLGEVRRLDELGLGAGLELELIGQRRALGRVEQALGLPDGPRRHRGEELCNLGRARG